jgi:hypothetical protein
MPAANGDVPRFDNQALTIKSQVAPGRNRTGVGAMIDLERALLLPFALVLFLFAAEMAAGLSWRGAPAIVIIAAR